METERVQAQEVAKFFGLTKQAVSLWRKKEEVPYRYHHQMTRLFSKNGAWLKARVAAGKGPCSFWAEAD